MSSVDTTVRGLDEEVYRQMKARAALEGKTIGQAFNEAIRAWLAQSGALARTGTLRELRPEPWGSGAERLSEQVDRDVYGTSS